MGNGGTGAFNNCAGQSWSMFPGPFDEAIWGAQYGGCSYREVSSHFCQECPTLVISVITIHFSMCRDSSEGSPSCDVLPPFPQDATAMELDGDSLVDLCK